ncbi:MAG: hypothetical protein IJ086_14175 [Clostridium sp.]|nr:hypothetical protein [Clostridium sp.]
MFGIDFTSIGSLKIKYLKDIDILLNNSNVTIHQTNGAISTIKDLKGQELTFTTIVIEDKKFKQLTIGSKLEKGYKKEYIILDLSIKEDGNNLIPLTKLEYDNRLNEVIEYIHNRYGLKLSIKEASFRLLELNNTVKMDRCIDEYYPILKLISDFAPKRYKNNAIARDGNKRLKGIFIGNNTFEYKIYNKTKQLYEVYKITVDGDYLRIEIVFLNSKKIKEIFGTTKIEEISMEMLETYFVEVVEKDLFKRIDKYIKDSNKKLKEIAKSEKEKDVRKWVKSFFLSSLSLKYIVKGEFSDIDLVFDIQQLLDIIKKDTGKNYSRAYKNLKEYIEEREYKKNNLDKYAEIKEKILNIKY